MCQALYRYVVSSNPENSKIRQGLFLQPVVIMPTVCQKLGEALETQNKEDRLDPPSKRVHQIGENRQSMSDKYISALNLENKKPIETYGTDDVIERGWHMSL